MSGTERATNPMFKRILVPIRGTRDDAAALDATFMLAGQFGANVESLYAVPLNAASVTFDAGERNPADEVNDLEGSELYRAALIQFFERLENASSIGPQGSVLSARFSALPGTEADLLAVNGRVSDLIIMAHPAGVEPAWPNLSVESAIRETGTPVLLIPRVVSRIGGRTVVAWNGSVEAARAVRFALPLLRQSVQTFVMTVGGQPRKSSGAKLVEYLHCHGVSGESVTLPLQDGSESATLLKECLVREADLVVMGAFTRYRTDRPTFGSMTQAMITQTQISALMAH